MRENAPNSRVNTQALCFHLRLSPLLRAIPPEMFPPLAMGFQKCCLAPPPTDATVSKRRKPRGSKVKLSRDLTRDTRVCAGQVLMEVMGEADKDSVTVGQSTLLSGQM